MMRRKSTMMERTEPALNPGNGFRHAVIDDNANRNPRRKGRTILVPIDFTAASQHALRTAFEIAKTNNDSVALLHVVEGRHAEGFLDPHERAKIRRNARRRVDGELKSFARATDSNFPPIHCLVRHGSAEFQILNVAEALKPDLLVLGRHRRNALSRMVFGSVSTDVVDQASCPVLIIPEPKP